MKRKISITEQDKSLFREEAKGIKRIISDTCPTQPPSVQWQASVKSKTKQARDERFDCLFHFSDQYQPLLPDEGPIRFIQAGLDKRLLKRLRRGDYQPELMLDLHGLTQQQAKAELSALLDECQRKHICCASVMTGLGKHILLQRLPGWLAQHPAVAAFHQAPKSWGGKAAFLVLIHTGDDQESGY